MVCLKCQVKTRIWANLEFFGTARRGKPGLYELQFPRRQRLKPEPFLRLVVMPKGFLKAFLMLARRNIYWTRWIGGI